MTARGRIVGMATRPGHFKVQFEDGTGSPRFGTRKAASSFLDEQIKYASRYLPPTTGQVYQYMDNGSYRKVGKPKTGGGGARTPSTVKGRKV